MQDLLRTIRERLCDVAEDRLSRLKILTIDVGGVHPKTKLETIADFTRAMDGGIIKPLADYGLSAVENASVDEYRRLLSDAISTYALVDGVLHVATREPFYAVEESRGQVYVALESNPTDGRIVAAFPIGMADEADAFAATYAASTGGTLEHLAHTHVDHGLSAPDRSALDNVIRVAEAAKHGFRSAFHSKSEPDAVGRLLFETAQEDLADVQRIHDFLSHPEAHDDETLDAICAVLRRAANGESAKAFTKGGRTPIELAIDLWENRAIEFSVTDRSPRP